MALRKPFQPLSIVAHRQCTVWDKLGRAMSLSPGDKLGPYEILEPIGKGGMGDVYRARDTRLKRDVAVKICNAQFSERFEREARAIAALNHSNICHLYDVGPNYLVMELVEGPTLAERIKEGPIPLEEALAIARQVAAALEAAHDKGITHRDLKPGNIKIRTDGVVKVLDFGLAKMGGTPTAQSEESPTLTMGETEQGMILGTASYMSPEQAKGKPVDQRSDIYAFGLVLYEMVTGKRLHRGETTTEVLASVIKDEPQWENVPAQLQLLLRRCLEKDPQKRLRHIGDAMALVDERVPAIQPAAAAQPAKKSWLWPSVAAGLVIAALGIAAWALWPKSAAPARATRFQVTLPEGVQFSQFVSLSPDGHKLVFNATGAQSGLWIHDLDTLEWRKLAGTENGVSPFWSPDSRFLAFGVANQLKKIEIAGGPPQILCDSPATVGSGAWNNEGAIVFGGFGAGPLRRVSAAGGVPVDVTTVDSTRGETFHSLPNFLPDGKHFLYLRFGTPEVAGIYAGSLDAKPFEQSKQRILANQFAARFADGNLFFMREGTLMAQPFDSGKLQLRGEPVPVAEHVATTGAIGIFSVSATGVLAYRAGADEAGSLNWLSREGTLMDKFGQPGNYYQPALLPDATRVAFRDAGPNDSGDIWLLDFTRGVRTRFTFRQGAGSNPVWSPDGNQIFFSAGSTRNTIYEKASNGARGKGVAQKRGCEYDPHQRVPRWPFPALLHRGWRALVGPAAGGRP
jgi:eukaryotic-like serine/threonine-protein kinase